MPYKIVKNPNGSYSLVSKLTGRIHSKNSTLANVKKQWRLLQFIEHGDVRRRHNY